MWMPFTGEQFFDTFEVYNTEERESS